MRNNDTMKRSIDELSPEELIGWARELVDGSLAEIGANLERSQLTDEQWKRMVDLGLFRLTLPREYGGRGLTMSEYIPVLETIARGYGSIRMIVHALNSTWKPLLRYGTAEQKKRYVSHVSAGEFSAFVLTEPDAGTGRDIKTEGRRVDGGFVLNGKKHWATLADRASVLQIFGQTVDETRRPLGISCFLVDPGAPGLEMEPMPPTMGCRGVDHYVVILRECYVPEGAVLGAVGDGLEIALRGFLDASRLSIATSCLGLAQAALEEAIAFAEQRITFGRAVATRQPIQGMLAEAGTMIHALRLMVREAASRYDRGLEITAEAAMAKLFGLETVGSVTDRAIRILGGIGYTSAYPIERMYRDARALWFEEGTAEIQKAVVARSLLRR